jgi:hypothetical protein
MGGEVARISEQLLEKEFRSGLQGGFQIDIFLTMKILFISDNFPPEVNAPASRTFDHASRWAEEGEEVCVLTCAPNFPQGKVYEGYKNNFFKKEEMSGIDVIRVWSYISSNEGFLKRTLDYLSFAFSSFVAGLFIKTDLIIATSPQFFTAVSAYFLSKIKRKPWVFELRDLWPESIKAVGAMKSEFIFSLLEKLELFLYRDADLIIALTQAFKDNLANRGIKEGKIKVVPNGANMDLFNPKPKNAKLEKKLRLAGKTVVGYIGTHGMAHGLDFIVKSIAKLKNKNIKFVFVGGGAQKNEVEKLAKEKNLKNVLFLDPVPKSEVADYWSVMDIALIPLRKQPVFETVLPSKIFEAAAMGKPILLGVSGEARRLVEKYKAGLCFEPEDEIDFLAKLEEISGDETVYARFKKGCEELAKNFDRKKLADEMLLYLKEAYLKQ